MPPSLSDQWSASLWFHHHPSKGSSTEKESKAMLPLVQSKLLSPTPPQAARALHLLQTWCRAVRLPAPPGPLLCSSRRDRSLYSHMQAIPSLAGRDNHRRPSGCTSSAACGQLIVWCPRRWLPSCSQTQMLPICGLIYLGYVCSAYSFISPHPAEKSVTLQWANCMH